jgi:hypothetical protein
MKIFFVTWLGTLSGLNGIIARTEHPRTKLQKEVTANLILYLLHLNSQDKLDQIL